MFRKIGNVLSTIFLIGLLVIAGILLFPPLFGLKSFAVLSGSMMPEIGVGELVFVKGTDAAELKVGDIITYHMGSSARVTHRIVEIQEEQKCVITKGDANGTADGTPVAFENIIGRVRFHVPYLGYLSIYGRTPSGIAVFCGTIMILIVLTNIEQINQKEEEKCNNEKKKSDNNDSRSGTDGGSWRRCNTCIPK